MSRIFDHEKLEVDQTSLAFIAWQGTPLEHRFDAGRLDQVQLG